MNEFKNFSGISTYFKDQLGINAEVFVPMSPYFKDQLEQDEVDMEDQIPYQLLGVAGELVKQANRYGYVLTIETQPQLPLSMGNYGISINIRKSRGNY